MTPSRGTKTLNALGFLNITDTLELALMIWFSFHLLTRFFPLVVLAQVTRYDDLVFSRHLTRFFPLFVFHLVTRFIVLVFYNALAMQLCD
jgi:hypothetical protein